MRGNSLYYQLLVLRSRGCGTNSNFYVGSFEGMMVERSAESNYPSRLVVSLHTGAFPQKTPAYNHGACFLRFSDVRFQRIPILSDQYGKQLLVHSEATTVSPIGLSRDWIIAKAPRLRVANRKDASSSCFSLICRRGKWRLLA